jgi:hypothetical protein
LHVYPDIICLYTTFHGKRTLLVSHVKKTNFSALTCLFTNMFLSSLHKPHKMFVLAENLCTDIECPDVHAKISFRFLTIFFNVFFIMGSFAPGSQNTTSLVPALYWLGWRFRRGSSCASSNGSDFCTHREVPWRASTCECQKVGLCNLVQHGLKQSIVCIYGHSCFWCKMLVFGSTSYQPGLPLFLKWCAAHTHC